MVVFAIHQRESATGVHVSSQLQPPFYIPPHPIPLGCPRAPALSALLYASNLHWSSILHILHMVIYVSMNSYVLMRGLHFEDTYYI